MDNYFRKTLLEISDKLKSLALKGTKAYFANERFNNVMECIIVGRNEYGLIICISNKTITTEVKNNEVYENEIDAYNYLIEICEHKVDNLNYHLDQMKKRRDELTLSSASKE